MLFRSKKPDVTAEVIKLVDRKRWFYTGDVGRFVKNAAGKEFLKITDRKKELLKTSNGKYVAPSPIEVKLKENFLIEQAIIIGDNRKYVTALLVPYEETLKSWVISKGLNWTNLSDAIKMSEVIDRFQKIIDGINVELSQTEQIQKFTLLPDPWEAIKTDASLPELTPTLKIKRRVILEKFHDEIENMYVS